MEEEERGWEEEERGWEEEEDPHLGGGLEEEAWDGDGLGAAGTRPGVEEINDCISH